MRFLIVLLLAACAGGQLTPAQRAEREQCYSRVEADTQARIDRECPGSYNACPLETRREIEAELKQGHEACP